MKYTLKYYFFRWLVGFANVIDGIIIIFTFGCYSPDFSLYMLGRFLDAVEDCERE